MLMCLSRPVRQRPRPPAEPHHKPPEPGSAPCRPGLDLSAALRALCASALRLTQPRPHHDPQAAAHRREESQRDQLTPYSAATRGIRRQGSAALDLAWTACGRYDGYWEMSLAPWDVAAGTALVRAAGGVCEDIRHQEPWPEGGYVYAGNPHIATALDDLIQKHT